MQWSKAKQRVEALFASSVAGRVELRVTGYRHAHDGHGRGWITIDGQEAWNFCTLLFDHEHYKLASEIRNINRSSDFRNPEQWEGYHAGGLEAKAILEQRGVIPRYQFQTAVEEYPGLSIEQALDSDELVHRALAVLDRRIGKRGLMNLDFRTDEHNLVLTLYRFRCFNEGVSPTGQTRKIQN